MPSKRAAGGQIFISNENLLKQKQKIFISHGRSIGGIVRRRNLSLGGDVKQ